LLHQILLQAAFAKPLLSVSPQIVQPSALLQSVRELSTVLKLLSSFLGSALCQSLFSHMPLYLIQDALNSVWIASAEYTLLVWAKSNSGESSLATAQVHAA